MNELFHQEAFRTGWFLFWLLVLLCGLSTLGVTLWGLAANTLPHRVSAVTFFAIVTACAVTAGLMGLFAEAVGIDWRYSPVVFLILFLILFVVLLRVEVRTRHSRAAIGGEGSSR